MTQNSPDRRKADILIIDDTPDNLHLLNEMLSRDYKVRLAPTAALGLMAARAAEPDLILLDIMMPEMNGYEVAAQLKADAQTREIPIIFISALDDISNKIQGFNAGGVDYVIKPFQEVEVLARVKTHVALRALYRQAQDELAERKRVEAELAKSEERFRLIVNSTEDIIFTLDREHRYTAIFGPWVEKNGLTPEDFIGKTAREVFDETTDVHEDANRRALAGEYVIYDWSLLGPDGTQYYQTSLSPLRDAGGEMIGIVGIGRNITDRKRMQEAEHQQRLLADALRDTAESLNSSLNLDDVFEKILDKVDQVVQCNAMSVAWAEDDQVRFVRVRGFEPEQAREMQALTFHWDDFATFSHVVKTRQPLLISNTSTNSLWRPRFMTLWVQSHIQAPIVIGNKVIGIIALDSATPGFYDQSHAEILQTFANQVAVAVRNAQLYGETQRLTVVDPLTGLYNRRGLYSIGERELERARRSTRPISVLFLDIDHFKQFNDTYSYKVGDQVLCAVARVIRTKIRKVDIFCRYGGEEFVLLMPELSAENATQTAERLRRAVETARHPIDAGRVSITISIGVATFHPEAIAAGGSEGKPEQALSDLIERAGKMLHVAKQNGRNRVEAEAPIHQAAGVPS